MTEQKLISQYLDRVIAQVRCREVHPEILLELEVHIRDSADEHEAAGVDREDAVRLALEQLGDPDRLGLQLNDAHRPRTEWGLVAATALLMITGLVVMLSLDRTGGWGGIFRDKAWATAAGLAAARALYLFDYRRLVRVAPYLFAATLFATPLAFRLTGLLQGPRLFLNATPILYAVALAGIFHRWNWSRPGAAWKAGALFGAPVLSYMMGPHLFLAGTYAVLFPVLMRASGARRNQFLPAAGFTAVGTLWAAVTAMTRPYLMARLTAFLHPFSDPLGAGYQVVQSLLAIQSAGVWGHGLFAPLDTVPEVQSEFVFTYIIHTLGWAGGAAACCVAAVFVARLLYVTKRVKDRFGALLVTGLAALFGLQFGWNVLMAVGGAPTMAVPLPFISHGWFTAVQIAAAGLAAGVFRRKDMGYAGMRKA